MLGTNNYCIVKCIKPKYETQSGIALAENVRKVPRWGFIIDVGEGLADMNGVAVPPPFDPGDLVYFFQHAPEDLDYTPESQKIGKLHVMHEADILIKLKVVGENVSLVPCGNLLHIEPLEDSVQKVSPGGIILPETKWERPNKAKVLAVGPGQRTVGGYYPPNVQPGDIIRYKSHVPFEVTFDDLGLENKKTFLIPYGDVVCRETEGYLTEIEEKLTNIKENTFSNIELI